MTKIEPEILDGVNEKKYSNISIIIRSANDGVEPKFDYFRAIGEIRNVLKTKKKHTTL